MKPKLINIGFFLQKHEDSLNVTLFIWSDGMIYYKKQDEENRLHILELS